MLLDAGPLSLVTHPRGGADAKAAKQWLADLLSAGVPVWMPEIADYELRRELLRAGKSKSIQRLNALVGRLGYTPLTTETMHLAAQNWADARNHGQPTAPDKELDADVILAAQATVLERDENEADVVVATTNVGHLSRFVLAEEWSRIGVPED